MIGNSQTYDLQIIDLMLSIISVDRSLSLKFIGIRIIAYLVFIDLLGAQKTRKRFSCILASYFSEIGQYTVKSSIEILNRKTCRINVVPSHDSSQTEFVFLSTESGFRSVNSSVKNNKTVTSLASICKISCALL